MSGVEEYQNDDLSPLEVIKQRHRKEKKELQAKIQCLKKSSSKGDKKKRKEVLEEIANLEKDLDLKHQNEFAQINQENTEPQETQDKEEDPAPVAPTQRVSKAQKRRKEKERKEKDREIEIQLAAEMDKMGVRQVEIDKLKSILSSRGLELKEISADGDCMFSAIADQVPNQTVASLRKSASNRLRETSSDVLPFMTNKNGDPLSPTEFETYCSNLETRPDMWGGEAELNALAHVLQRRIEVIQAEGSAVLLGEDFKERVILTYHRHMFGLGEHYNSVRKIN